MGHAHDQLRDVAHDARSASASSLGESPLLRNQAPMPPQESIRRDYRVEFQQSLSPYSLGFTREESTFGVSEADSPSAQPLSE